MIVRQRLEWSLGVHVRLARVSCGATLPIPDCLQTVTSYQGHAGYNYIPTLASSYFISLPPPRSLVPPRLLFSISVLLYSDAMLIVSAELLSRHDHENTQGNRGIGNAVIKCYLLLRSTNVFRYWKIRYGRHKIFDLFRYLEISERFFSFFFFFFSFTWTNFVSFRILGICCYTFLQ
ncbi:hypothetical protein WH47_01090 [Habropoda laboriosa]|uniref:Uncharacterized protein n=1 Tax=Habropoda laboriosa TaxID=597456 RepID=A0A0L7R132_9HYME|nr:hypothetical protein WH47_01090 [Habropoda laboriosa]